MKKYVVGVRREDQDKRSERRVAVTPVEARKLVDAGFVLLVQPSVPPGGGDDKRAFADRAYQEAGAIIQEDLSVADIIIGLKEIDLDAILPNKVYLLFSHTHKGQKKNRAMLQRFVECGATVFDYELIVDQHGQRLLTAFTYFAGYAGMIDSLWTFGRRMEMEGVAHPFTRIPQSIERGDLGWFRTLLQGQIHDEIVQHGTPAELPPMITCILGRGKTSHGAQEIYDLLPCEEITIDQLEDVFRHGVRNKVYKLVLEVYDMYRLKPDATPDPAAYAALPHETKFRHYLAHPEEYESNLDQVLPYVSMLMNCILWSPRYPRVLPNALMQEVATAHQCLRVIGDITCDPNGAIEFSKETWVDAPVYTFSPLDGASYDGFVPVDRGVQVMAVTNLPCAFSADASRQFAAELAPLLMQLLQARFDGTLEDAGLPDSLAHAVLLWRGQFPPRYEYMKEYLSS